jgi:hypothetical protein
MGGREGRTRAGEVDDDEEEWEELLGRRRNDSKCESARPTTNRRNSAPRDTPESANPIRADRRHLITDQSLPAAAHRLCM